MKKPPQPKKPLVKGQPKTHKLFIKNEEDDSVWDIESAVAAAEGAAQAASVGGTIRMVSAYLNSLHLATDNGLAFDYELITMQPQVKGPSKQPKELVQIRIKSPFSQTPPRICDVVPPNTLQSRVVWRCEGGKLPTMRNPNFMKLMRTLFLQHWPWTKLENERIDESAIPRYRATSDLLKVLS